jgi:SagB-type dehydrogenase family enzyme
MMLFLNEKMIGIRTAESSKLEFLLTDGANPGLQVAGTVLFNLLDRAREGITDSDALLLLEAGGTSEPNPALTMLVTSGVLRYQRERRPSWDSCGWYEPWIFHQAARDATFLEYTQGAPGQTPSLVRDKAKADYWAGGEGLLGGASKSGDVFSLEAASAACESMSSLLAQRRTMRDFKNCFIEQMVLGSVLAAGCARSRLNRAAQANKDNFLSHSDLIPFEVICAVHRVTGLDPGIYRYDIDAHELSLVRLGDYEEDVVNCIWGQPMGYQASFSLFITSVFERYQCRYRSSRAYMNLLLGLGEFGQYIILAAHNAGLGACMTPALRDAKISQLLGIDGRKEEALYYIGVGVPEIRIS